MLCRSTCCFSSSSALPVFPCTASILGCGSASGPSTDPCLCFASRICLWITRSPLALISPDCIHDNWSLQWGPWKTEIMFSYVWGFPGGTSGKEPTCQCRRHKRCKFSPWVRKIPWSRVWQPTPVFLPGEFCGQRSLAGYSPWGRKESYTTEAT